MLLTADGCVRGHFPGGRDNGTKNEMLDSARRDGPEIAAAGRHHHLADIYSLVGYASTASLATTTVALMMMDQSTWARDNNLHRDRIDREHNYGDTGNQSSEFTKKLF